MLLTLATGSGKTIISTNLLWRLGQAGQLPKPALFLCDRDELRGLGKPAAVMHEAKGRLFAL